MEQQNVLLLFKGVITPELLTSILKITENKLETIQEEPKIKKKVFNVLVECLQNVYHHLENIEQGIPIPNNNSKSAILVLGKNDQHYFIYTGNNVPKDKSILLKERLDYLNNLSMEELKNLYQEVLKKDGFSDKGGAGLGFIDILKKTGQKINYTFEEVDEVTSFLSINVKINFVKN